MDREIENYNVQAIGTTILFSMMIIFGFVFWKIFAGENIHLLPAAEEARAQSEFLGGEAVSRFP